MKDKSKVFLMAVFLISTITLAAASISTLAFGETGWVYSEGGALEILQAFLLFFAFLYYAHALFQKNASGERMIILFFAVLMWAFILREVDFDKMGLPSAAVFMLYGRGRTITLVVGFAAALIGAAMRFKHYLKASLSFVFSKRGVLMVAACVLLWTGYVFEHRLEVANAELFEEGFELAAYCLILASAVMTERISGDSFGSSLVVGESSCRAQKALFPALCRTFSPREKSGEKSGSETKILQ